jgi:hypothetical protein
MPNQFAKGQFQLLSDGQQLKLADAGLFFGEAKYLTSLLNNLILFLNFSGPEHHGDYACLATNKLGQASRQFHVQVIIAPHMEGHPGGIHSVEAFEGNTFTMVCPVKQPGAASLFGNTQINWSAN